MGTPLLTAILGTIEILADGSPMEIPAQGQVHCVGQGSDFKWNLEPALGQIKFSSNPQVDVVTYQPPASIAVNMDVKIVVRFHGYGQNNPANVIVKILKPQI